MTPTIPDLWPDSFGEPPTLSPLAILRQQGIRLGQKTENFVYGEVRSVGLPGGEFAHVLEVVAPHLAYRQPIAVAYHTVDLYPAKIGRPDPKWPMNSRGLPTIDQPLVVNSAPEFMDALKAILQAEGTTKLIRTLYDQTAESGTTTTTTAEPRY